jgi:DNA repair exonuclease SbcCD nuclease subunit
MSKILICGDLHQRFSLPYADCIPDGRKSEWESIKAKMVETSKDCQAVVFLGDFYNARHNHSTVLKDSIDFLRSFGDKEIHIIVGNHSRYGDSTALDFLKNIPHTNWFIYTEPMLTVVAGQEAFMIPFMTPSSLGAEDKEDGLKKLLAMFPKNAIPLAFVHHGITGSKIHGQVIDFFNEIVLPQKKMEQHFSHIFGGHIHGKQNIFPSIYITGNVLTQEVGDHSKSIWTYESNGTIDVEIKEIPLPVRGIYKLEWSEDAEKIYGGIPKNSIVKCYVTTRGTNIELVKETLSRFDASIIVEQYLSERSKVHFEDGGLDLSVESMLKKYAEAKKLSYADLSEGFELIKK